MNRLGFLGASDFGPIIGVSKFKSARDLWLEKTEQVEPFAGNLYTDVGEALELLIVGLAAQKLDLTITLNQYEAAPAHEPWLKVHIDALAINNDARRFIIEAKTCSYAKRDGGWGKEGGEDVPAEYFVQVQAQMHAARLCNIEVDTAYIACLFLNRLGDGREKQPQIFPVKYDEAMCLRLMERGREFWKCVETKTWPLEEVAA